jgi:RNA polymerase sigma factor (sigma-70 family)
MIRSVESLPGYALSLRTRPIDRDMRMMPLDDEQQIDRLFEEEGPKLWRAVVAFTQDRSLASDAVAEAFAQCLRRGDAVRDPRAWLWRASFRIAAGELKERGRWSPLPEGWDSPTRTDGDPAELLAAIGRLAPMQRATLILHHYVGYDPGEIATMLGVARATVRVHLSRGRRRLRTILEEDDA